MNNAPHDQLDRPDASHSQSDLEREMEELLAQSDQPPADNPEQLDNALVENPHSSELDSILNTPDESPSSPQFEPASPPVVAQGDLVNTTHQAHPGVPDARAHEVVPIASESGIDELIASVEKSLGELAEPMQVPTIKKAGEPDPANVQDTATKPSFPVSSAPEGVPATIDALDATLARTAENELSRQQMIELGNAPAPSTDPVASGPVSSDPSPTPASKPSTKHEVKAEPRPALTKTEKRPSWFITTLDPAARRLVARASAPLASRPPAVRRVVGYLSINTLLMGACLWGYAIFVRPHQLAAAQSQPFSFETSGLPAPSGEDNHAGHDDHAGNHTPHVSTPSGKKSANGSHGSEKKSDDAHAKDDKAKERSNKPLLSGGTRYVVNDKLSAKKDKPKEAKAGGAH